MRRGGSDSSYQFQYDVGKHQNESMDNAECHICAPVCSLQQLYLSTHACTGNAVPTQELTVRFYAEPTHTPSTGQQTRAPHEHAHASHASPHFEIIMRPSHTHRPVKATLYRHGGMSSGGAITAGKRV